MNVGDWIGLAGVLAPLLVGMVGWLMRLETRMARLEDFRTVIMEHNARKEQALEEIRALIDSVRLQNARIDEQIKTLFERLK